jgi:hypothetical protein
LVGKQKEERQRYRGKDIKMDRVHSGFIWSTAESSYETNLLPSLNLTRRGARLNDFTVGDICKIPPKKQTYIFRHICKIPKSNYQLHHVCPPVYMEHLGSHYINSHRI